MRKLTKTLFLFSFFLLPFARAGLSLHIDYFDSQGDLIGSTRKSENLEKFLSEHESFSPLSDTEAKLSQVPTTAKFRIEGDGFTDRAEAKRDYERILAAVETKILAVLWGLRRELAEVSVGMGADNKTRAVRSLLFGLEIKKNSLVVDESASGIFETTDKKKFLWQIEGSFESALNQIDGKLD